MQLFAEEQICWRRSRCSVLPVSVIPCFDLRDWSDRTLLRGL